MHAFEASSKHLVQGFTALVAFLKLASKKKVAFGFRFPLQLVANSMVGLFVLTSNVGSETVNKYHKAIPCQSKSKKKKHFFASFDTYHTRFQLCLGWMLQLHSYFSCTLLLLLHQDSSYHMPDPTGIQIRSPRHASSCSQKGRHGTIFSEQKKLTTPSKQWDIKGSKAIGNYARNGCSN